MSEINDKTLILQDVESRIQAEASEIAKKEANSKKPKKSKLDISNLEAMRKEIQRRQEEITPYDLLQYYHESTLGDAKLFQLLHHDMIVFVQYWNRFLVWNGSHWVESNDSNLHFEFVENVCEVYVRVLNQKKDELSEVENKKDAKEKIASLEALIRNLEKRVARIRTPVGGEAILTMIQRIKNPMIVLPQTFDTHNYLLPCPNGVIDLRTGELLSGSPKSYLLKHAITKYDSKLFKEENPAPETNSFLLRSMDGDQELVNFIWRLLGYGMIRDRKDHIFTIFHGEHGRNGKDTLIKLITSVLGLGLSGDIPVEIFLQSQIVKNSSAPSPDILALKGMCLGWINEAEEGQRFALSRLKKLTGGGYITARGLQDKEPTTWLQTHLPIMTTNELPRAKADDAAFWQRAVILRWTLSFVDDPKESYQRLADKNLDQKLATEKEGVLVMLVRGAMEYLQNGLQVPDKVKKWTDEQRLQWDDVGQFIEECCKVEDFKPNQDEYKTRISAKDLLDAFHIWYSQNKDAREKAKLSAKLFSQLLNKKNIPTKRSNGSYRLGLQLNSEWEKKLNDSRR